MIERLKALYEEIESLDDENPAELSKKILLYTQALQLVGKYHSEATREHGRAYAERKKAWGEALATYSGTGKEKEGAAEVACYELRQQEAEAEADMWKWRNSFNATQEVINALKIQLKTLMKEYDNAG
jgi:hypothetical protein